MVYLNIAEISKYLICLRLFSIQSIVFNLGLFIALDTVMRQRKLYEIQGVIKVVERE